jgi:hypothetical protein
VCTQAAREYRREQRARSLASGTLTHGFRSTYDAGCRCDDCHQARQRALSVDRVSAARRKAMAS